jgi:hypothetical protein
MIPEPGDEGVIPPQVLAGSVDGLGAVVTLEPSGRVDGGFAAAGGDAGLVAVWLEQAAQMPSNIANSRISHQSLPIDGYLTGRCGDRSLRISRQKQQALAAIWR